MTATETVEDRQQAGPNEDQQRITSLEIGNRTLTKRNADLAAKTLQACDWFNYLAARASMGRAAPSIANLEACAAYFYDTGKFLPDIKPFCEPADDTGGEAQ